MENMSESIAKISIEEVGKITEGELCRTESESM